MQTSPNKLFSWQDCLNFNNQQVHNLYQKYINKSQASLLGSFAFGRITATYAEGMYIYTSDGRQILDFTGGMGVLNNGHNHPRILAARTEFQKQKRMEIHKNFLSQYLAGLSHNIAQLLPEDLDISYFCNSGAEAVEGAVKLAYKYFNGERKYILHSDISFHGKLLGSAGLTASPEVKFKFPTIPNRESFKFNDIVSVKEMISRLRKSSGESDVYALILEPFNASSLRQCSTEFLKELREICSQENIPLIFDEVYTGWAKSGELFYFMKHQVVPDILVYSKSFGGGKASISGYTTRTPIFRKAYDNLNDAVIHSTTYNGFGEETITAMEAINIMVEEDFVSKSKNIHHHLNQGLKRLQEKYPDLIKEIRGSGSLNGIILNPKINSLIETAIRFLPGGLFKDERFMAKLITCSVMSHLFDNFDILTSYGQNKEIPLLISPSLIVTEAELNRFLGALDQTLAVGKYRLIVGFAKQKFFGKS
ncbi:aspartate aminotransferase family protein [bacterium]|nr:aspartate aminotransferase family protein [bacterium]